jgi:amino acid adenylation domain-containing protein
MHSGILGTEEKLIAFHLLFEQQVSATPERIAVIHEETQWTYQQLKEQADQIADCLRDRCLKSEERVGICLDRSPTAIACMIGIMKAGGAFVPLDPELPHDRLCFILTDAEISLVLCHECYRGLFSDLKQVQSIVIDQDGIHGAEVDSGQNVGQWITTEVEPEQLAYVMYTSGSTGKPKGVMIEHRSLAAYCWADIDVYHLTAEDRTLHFSTINFDISIEEIFPPLLIGGSVVIRHRGRSDSHNELSALILEHDITAIHLATAYWHEWVDLMTVSGEFVPETLRLMVVTGEKVSVQHYQRWQKICRHSVQWSNAYGPTEATVSATVFTPDANWSGESMPIGYPLRRYEAYILDDRLRPLELGNLGELAIAGPALARGYLNRQELTEKAFVEITCADGMNRRIYRTGDLARVSASGAIEFAGRIDHQIKLGSYRIEPGEIESVIQQFPRVLEALVLHERIGENKYLIAYVARGEYQISAKDLQDYLRDNLPTYMIPQRFLFVERFPKTINGKVDRTALPSAEQAETVQQHDGDRDLDGFEKQIAEMWQDVLQIRSIGPTDNFFFLGGSSLLVTRVVTKIKERFDIQLPVRDFFANPTLEGLAAYLVTLPGFTSDRSQSHHPKIVRPWIPNITATFIDSDKERLFSICYPPRKASRNHTVVICPAIGHEYSRSHRNCQQLALMLANEGYESVRFDYAYTGDSTGTCELANIPQWKKDIETIRKALSHSQPKRRLSLIGIRWGATLLANVTDITGEQMILWDPVCSGAEYIKLLQRFTRRTLRDYVRYPVRRKSSKDQLYGLTASSDLQQAISEMSLPEVEHTGFKRTTLISSKNYLKSEMGNSSVPNTCRGRTVIESDDEIFWHRPELTECAFASPNTSRIILELLNRETE